MEDYCLSQFLLPIHETPQFCLCYLPTSFPTTFHCFCFTLTTLASLLSLTSFKHVLTCFVVFLPFPSVTTHMTVSFTSFRPVLKGNLTSEVFFDPFKKDSPRAISYSRSSVPFPLLYFSLYCLPTSDILCSCLHFNCLSHPT